MTVFLRQCRNIFIKYESNHLAILVRRSSSNSSSKTRSSFTKSGKVEIWIIYFLVPTLPLHISQYKQIIHIPRFDKQNINTNCPSLPFDEKSLSLTVLLPERKAQRPKKCRTSILVVYALTCLQNKPKNLHESISFRYHLYLLNL